MSEFQFQPEQIADRVQPLLAAIVQRMGLELTFQVQRTTGWYNRPFENPDLVVSFEGQDTGLLIENKGELLQALEHVVFEAIGVPPGYRERILFDCNEYRMMRMDELQLAAQAAADRVRRTGVTHTFNPMSSRERRVIHMALREKAEVRTQSEGVGPHRHVVIHSAEPSPARQPLGGRRPSR